jgi:hypothetical protein
MKLKAISKKKEDGFNISIVRIKRSAVLTAILFILFLFIDPPVTILGWMLSLGIAVFLVYIILQIYLLSRTWNNVYD